jgi:two-component system, chemotaxis family, chemotaxis protein CheY
MLEQEGYVCSEAGDADAGLELLRRGPQFRVALVDWDMPGMNGLDMVKVIRAEEFAGVKIMMVTAHCDSHGIMEALEAGADEYLMKPFDGESLREKLALLGLEAE